MTLLQVSELTKQFGGLTAVDCISMTVGKGEIVGLIGPNGAGKTTFVNLLTGILSATAGTIMFDGRDITRLKPHARCHEGISRTFQIPQPFIGMTVEDNVAAAVLFGHLPDCRNVVEARLRAGDFLRTVGMGEMANKSVGELTTAGLKRLELARCLAGNAKLMLLDEPLGGLNQSELKSVLELIHKIRDTGKTIIFIEHIMPAVMSVSDRVVVLANGAKLAEGTPKDILVDENVQRAYLGDVDGVVERYADARRVNA